VNMYRTKARKWVWVGLPAVVALRIYIIQQLLVALMFFTVVFALLAFVGVALYLVDCAGQAGFEWLGRHVRPALQLARRGWALSETSVEGSPAIDVQSLSSNGAGVVGAKE
jgi:hypothetical protein